MNLHGTNNINGTFNIANIEEMRAKVRAMQAEADRSQVTPNLRDMAIDMGELSYATEESRRTAWEAEFGFSAMMNALDYSNINADEMNKFVNIVARNTVGGGRNLSEMVSFLEEQLRNLENNTDISDERRALERSIIEEGFVRAVSIQHRQVRHQQGTLINNDRDSAEANALSTMHFALGVMQNVESLSDNAEIQSLITRSMEELVNRNINTGFMLPRNNGAQSEDAFRELLAERNALRNSMEEMFETLRAQMQSGERQFQLVQGIDVHV